MHDRQAGRLMTAVERPLPGEEVGNLGCKVAMAAGCSCTLPVGSICCYTTGQIPIIQ